jgi:hypothetical protein
VKDVSFRKQLESCHDNLVVKILDNGPEISPTLYHYTSLDNAAKILNTGKL